MITITSPRGIMELPHIEADDAETIKGNCAHGVCLFDDCFECLWQEYQDRFREAFYSNKGAL